MGTARLNFRTEGSISVLTLDRPEHHNCIDGPTAEGIGAAITEFAADDAARVLIVTGAGGNFCSGADLRDISSLRNHAFYQEAGPLGFARLDPGKPTIAAIEGNCLAGGLEFAAWCDFRIASTSAQFGGLNRRWGIPFIDGGTQRFARIVGLSNALWMIEAGVLIDASRAQRIGFVQEVVPEGSASDRASDIAGRIAGYPQASLRADRRSVLEGIGVALSDGLSMERRSGEATLGDRESRQRLDEFDRGERPEPPRPADAFDD